MSRWARWTTKPNPGLSLNKFMAEAPMAPMASSDPKAEAERLGLEFAGFGWYRDPKTGKRVAKIEGDKLVQYGPDAGTAATTHTGNPTNPASGMTPADKARSMGLQSDGSGGYIDPSTGQVVAKTVNNELVFYDAQGGAISDGSGGEQLTQSSPSWVDPVSGLIIVPPAQPESPEEQAAVPDSTPALAPMGLDAFFNKRKLELYKQQAAEDAAQGDIDSQQAAVDEKYSQFPEMGRLQSDMSSLVDKAMNSGDKDKIGAATIAQDSLVEKADEIASMYERTAEEDHGKLTGLLTKMLIVSAKDQYYEENEDAPSIFAQARSSLKKINSEINDLIDKGLDTKEFPKAKKTPKEVSANGITYSLTPKKMLGYEEDVSEIANNQLRDDGSELRVDKNPKILEVEWDVEGAEEQMNPSGNRKKLGGLESKKKGLAALKTWRTKVLPELSPGQIVTAETLVDEGEERFDTQRERIYQLAGFGKRRLGNTTSGMYGLVMQDENGQNYLTPIDPTDKQKRGMRMESIYLRLNDGILNINEAKVVAEMLLT